MKQIKMVEVLCFLAALLMTGVIASAAKPNGIDEEETFTRPQIRCETLQRKPCTEDDVRTINEARRSYDGKRKEAVEHISRVTLIAPRRGILKCERLDGKPCNAAQRMGLSDVANKKGYRIIIEGPQTTGSQGWSDRQ